jgi:hypothetical protein
VPSMIAFGRVSRDLAVAIVLTACGAGSTGNREQATTAAPSPTNVAAILEDVLPVASNVPSGFTVDDVTTGTDALHQPLAEGSELPSIPGFLDARLVRVGTSGQGSYWQEGGYATWGAAYTDAEHAATAFDALAREFEASDGWGMDLVDGGPTLGDETVTLEGEAYGFGANRVLMWRYGSMLLATVGVGEPFITDSGLAHLRSIASAMQARAESE